MNIDPNTQTIAGWMMIVMILGIIIMCPVVGFLIL